MDKRIGAQYFTIREYCKTLEDFDESCKKVHDIGYRVVQLSGIGDFSATDVKEVLDKYDLECVCTHRPPVKYLEELDKEIEFHKTIGCNVCGLGCMPAFNAKPETVDDFVRDFAPVCEKLAEHNLIFAYHNHAFEFEKRNGRYVFEEILERMPYDNFKLILDVYWLAFAGVNPAKFIQQYGDRIACIHFKDLKIVDNAPKYSEVGLGNLDWDELIEAANASSASHALVEQDECDGDPFEALKTSYDFLKGKGFY